MSWDWVPKVQQQPRQTLSAARCMQLCEQQLPVDSCQLAAQKLCLRQSAPVAAAVAMRKREIHY